MIHVCSLARLHETVEETGASHVVTLLRDMELLRLPRGIVRANHLVLRIDDVTMPVEGYTPPAEEHVIELLNFVRNWDRNAPVIMHCYAGISRSSAAAYVSVCALNPHRDEGAVALELRRASPIATPNIRLVSVADALLGRDGRMVAAVEAIGRGETATEGVPFRLELE